MNLNKFTKQELIERFKKLQNKSTNKNGDNNSNNQSIFNSIISIISNFKVLLLKITLLAFLIKIFKKYSLLRKVWTITNWSILSIFGISVMDIYGIGLIKDFIDTLRNNSIYTWFSHLLNNKPIDVKTPSRLKPINSSTGTNENGTGLIERIKERIISEPQPIKEESNYNKYLILLGLLLIAGTSYYFWDEISSFPFKINLPFRWSSSTDKDVPNSNKFKPGSDNMDNNSIFSKIKNWWYKTSEELDPVTNLPIDLDKVPTDNSWKKRFTDWWNKNKNKNKNSNFNETPLFICKWK